MKSAVKSQLTTGKAPLAMYFNDISPGLSEAPAHRRTGDCDARIHFLFSCSNIPASSESRSNLHPSEFFGCHKQGDLPRR
ncbi:BnaC03g65640D [Brassica napus]|uniref:BnaC03g65640D protein n=1 Tax=Brassica napus TaxID=3708 RepID=A0A078FWI9_BRANA|nr:BnaC03g65640D [Brassica napus]